MMWCLSRGLRETGKHTKYLSEKRQVQAEGIASIKAEGGLFGDHPGADFGKEREESSRR